MESRSPGVWNVGLAVGGDLLVQPAYLLVFRGAEEFSNAALSLMFDVEGAFTIIAPTGRHWTGTLRERMCPPRINFTFPLTNRSALMTPEDSRQFDSHPRRKI